MKSDLNLTPATEMIVRERSRQMSEEGWTTEHDDSHRHGELRLAGVSYAYYINPLQNVVRGRGKPLEVEVVVPPMWPWDKKWWKPSPDKIRNLVKAAALIAAEIDRLLRLGGQVSAKPCPRLPLYSERVRMAEAAEKWCADFNLPLTAFNIVSSLSAMGMSGGFVKEDSQKP